jgi:hypothetical protein
MASQSSNDDLSTPVETPSTPQPQGLELPSKVDLARSTSPTTSMLVASSGSSGIHSSFTPPPSSQAPNTRRPVSSLRESITPEPTALSSPPPTVVNGTRKEASNSTTLTRPTQEQIANASPEELQEMLKAALAENSKLVIRANEARMSAAHYKLQHNLLTIESEDALKRYEVEQEMTRREIEVIRENRRDSASTEYIKKMKDYCKNLEDENVALHRRVEKAKRLIEDKEDQLVDAQEEIHRLQDRIRTNREHFNILRSPGGPLHISTPKTGPSTPQQYRTTPKHTPATNRSSVRYVRERTQDNQEKFNALILAGSVLSQENNSAPSTPVLGRRPEPRTPSRHNRGVQSLSSLPTTPGSGRSQNAASTLLPSAQFSPESEARMTNTLSHAVSQQSRQRRRKSRDSTISASDNDEDLITPAGNPNSFRQESEEVQESQASQSATEMLRADPRESFEVAASRSATPTVVDKNLQQAKLFGGVTKRKLEEDGVSPIAKKLRTGEGIGLGIGFEAGRAST